MHRLRRGFTLAEMLVVIAVIGILAAIAIPKFGKTREKAYWATVKADLNSLQLAQERYYAANDYVYGGTGGVSAGAVTGLDFSPSEGIIVTIRGATDTGWGADARHTTFSSATQKCAIFRGSVPVSPASVAGRVTCTGE